MNHDEKGSRRIGELTEDAVKFSDAMTEHLLDCGDDLTLLTLKGHLVVEHLLDVILSRLLNIPGLPAGKGRLSFYKKLKLVEAVVCIREPGPNADLFCAISKLNDVRNQLAHNLKKPREIEKDIETLVRCYYEKAGKKWSPKKGTPIALDLRICLIKLAQFLFSNRIHFYDLENG